MAVWNVSIGRENNECLTFMSSFFQLQHRMPSFDTSVECGFSFDQARAKGVDFRQL